MNYYPRYPGDYLIKTVGITMIEDGAYTRLLDWYYSNERPIEHESRYDVARATTAAAREAVDKVLRQFFTRDGDLWRHERADEEITKAAPRIEAAKQNGSKGGRKPSRQPTGLPKKNPVGYPPGNPTGSPPANPAANPTGNPVANPAASPAANRLGTPAETQRASSPDPSPTPETVSEGCANSVAREEPPAELNGTRYGAITKEIRRAGIANAHPEQMRFRMLVDAGATVAEFLSLVPKALSIDGDRFAYLLACVEGERKRIAATAGQLHRGPLPGTQDDPMEWAKTRTGVMNRANSLGIQPFDEAAAQLGNGPSWNAYRRHVIEADEAQRQGAAA